MLLATRLGTGRASKGRLGAAGSVLGGRLCASWHAPGRWLGASGRRLGACGLGHAICSPGCWDSSRRLIGDEIWPEKGLVEGKKK